MIILIRRDPSIIRHFNRQTQTEYLCEVAVRQCGMALLWVHKQTTKICCLALRQDPHAINYVVSEDAALDRYEILRVYQESWTEKYSEKIL
jgi:hypothetical protein